MATETEVEAIIEEPEDSVESEPISTEIIDAIVTAEETGDGLTLGQMLEASNELNVPLETMMDLNRVMTGDIDDEVDLDGVTSVAE